MDSSADRPDGAPPRPESHPGAGPEVRGREFTVVVERSGGIAGMLRRWSAPVPDDGRPAARAAHRIERSMDDPDRPVPGADGSSIDPQKPGNPARVRDGFLWNLYCGEGALRCDDAGRRRDPELDALIREVTEHGRAS